MRRMIRNLWRDERAFIGSTELILMATIVVISLIVGLATYRDQLVQELGDSASAVSHLNQSYSVEITNITGPNVTNFTPGGPTGQNSLTTTFSYTVGANTYNTVSVTKFNNYLYTDQLDFCAAATDTSGKMPSCLGLATSNLNEGEAPAPTNTPAFP